MAYSWEKEKAYCERRAQEFAAEMEAAVDAADRDRFLAAFRDSARYLSRKQRNQFYLQFLGRVAQ